MGNVGSRHKFKYGALGNTVNLASRVQGATKYFKASVLLTGETASEARRRVRDAAAGPGEGGRHRRAGAICTSCSPRTGRSPARPAQEYEKALAHFEKGEFGPAARTLGNWRGQCPTDDPVLVLMYRAVRAMVEGVPAGPPGLGADGEIIRWPERFPS